MHKFYPIYILNDLWSICLRLFLNIQTEFLALKNDDNKKNLKYDSDSDYTHSDILFVNIQKYGFWHKIFFYYIC